MTKLEIIVKAVLTSFGGALGWFVGGCDGFIIVLVAFVIADYITGVCNAIINKKLSSSVGFKGICRKVAIFIMVGIANLLDYYLLGNTAVVRTATIFFYIANEGISLLENTSELGLPVPDKIKEVLIQIKTKGE